MTVISKDKLPDWIDFDLDIGDIDPEWAIEFLNVDDRQCVHKKQMTLL